jgi:hypothetical protein
MKIEQLLHLIENKKVTTEDFNLFIEDLPSSRVELARQHMRVDPGFEQSEDPGTKGKTITRPGKSDPNTTGQGKQAGRRSRRKLKSKYGAAVEFIDNYNGKPLTECQDALEQLRDKECLGKLVSQLLIAPDHNVDRDWLWDIKSVL